MPQKLTREMMVLGSAGNHHAAVTVPAGKMIEILGPAQDDRFVRIQVDGEQFEAFQTDVQERVKDLASNRRAAVNRDEENRHLSRAR